MLILRFAFPPIRAEGVAVSHTILGAELGDRELAEPSRQWQHGRIRRVLARTAELIGDAVARARIVIGSAWHAVETEVTFGHGSIGAAMVNVDLALQTGETVGTGTVHSILVFLRMNRQVQTIVRVLVPLDAEATGPTMHAGQIADRHVDPLDHLDVAKIA